MTARRVAATAVALLTALVVAAGCTAAQLPGAAAIVDGTVISTQEVETTTEQINSVIADSTQQMSQVQTVYWLVIAPFVNDKATATGRWTPDTSYNTLLAGIREPTESTIAVLKARFAVNALTQEDRQQVVSQIAAADIQMDPRYGAIDPQTGGWVKQEPNWIRSSPSSTATP